jgi:alpha-maltose-1-phosphate synthase
MRPRVLILTSEYPPRIVGGAGVYLEGLTANLSATMPLEILVLADGLSASSRVRWIPADLQTDVPPSCRPALTAAARSVRACAAATTTDIVHCHTWYSFLAGVLAKKVLGCRLIVTVFSLDERREWKAREHGASAAYVLWVERTAIEMADAVIVPSADTRHDVCTMFGVPPERVFVVPGGVDTTRYYPAMELGAVLRYGIDAHRPYVLFMGRLTPQKGLPLLLASSSLLPSHVQLVLCTDDARNPEFERHVRELVDVCRLSRDVIWIQNGVWDHQDKRELYTHAALFCCPSLYETFALAALEAAACGTPVVASAVGGVADFVHADESGFLIDPPRREVGTDWQAADARFCRELGVAMRRIIDSPDRRGAMGDAARKRAETFTWATTAALTERIYELVAAGATGAQRLMI